MPVGKFAGLDEEPADLIVVDLDGIDEAIALIAELLGQRNSGGGLFDQDLVGLEALGELERARSGSQLRKGGVVSQERAVPGRARGGAIDLPASPSRRPGRRISQALAYEDTGYDYTQSWV